MGIGATYALASQGLIVIYRGSGVLNFALGAIGMAGAYVWWELTTNQGWAFLPGARSPASLFVGGDRRARPPASSCDRCATRRRWSG